MAVRRLLVAMVAGLALLMTGLGAAAFAVHLTERPVPSVERLAAGSGSDSDRARGHEHHRKHSPGHHAGVPAAGHRHHHHKHKHKHQDGGRHQDDGKSPSGRDRHDDPRPCDEPG